MLSQPVCSVLIIQFSSMGFSYGCLVYICYSFLTQDAQPIPISYFFLKNLKHLKKTETFMGMWDEAGGGNVR